MDPFVDDCLPTSRGAPSGAMRQLEADGLVYSQSYKPLDDVAADPDAWDDTALVAAFDAAVSSYNAPGQRERASLPSPTLTRGTRSTAPPAIGCGLARATARAVAHHDDHENDNNNNDMRDRESSTASATATACGQNERTPATAAWDLPSSAPAPPSSSSAAPPPTGLPARLLIPPPPPLLQPGALRDEELEQLLVAWYEAGYRAGSYVARRRPGACNHGL